ncbi:substrate-binding domain-containing protein [Nocardioides lijunqiniae]|uniref:substrate-binding domain-containing protein n=1 Tax=Nocardioides lijunqiniae TaxID=2760832 RepID=UPI00187825A4
MPRSLAALLATCALLLGGLAAPPAVAAVPYAQVEGSGPTWGEWLLSQWIADVDARGMEVVYMGGGSTRGGADFARGVTDFAVTDLPYDGTDQQGDPDGTGREFASLPMFGGGTAFTYQLRFGSTVVRNLRLSGATLAKIFTDEVTDWADPAISADNNGRRLPSLPIVPVVRADDAGSTYQLTSWLDHEHPTIWRPYQGGPGPTSHYPLRDGSAMLGRDGSAEVMDAVHGPGGNGSIGYLESSYPYSQPDVPVVAVENAAGYFVRPTPANVAVALRHAEVGTDHVADLEGVYDSRDRRSYPLSSYASMVVPTGAQDRRMTTSKRQTLVDVAAYAVCAGQRSAAPYGYAPLPRQLVAEAFGQLARVGAADARVDMTGRDAAGCDTPDHAATAPQPYPCQARGAGPCGNGTATNTRAPALLGPVRVGATVRVDRGDWAGVDAFGYQWLVEDEEIPGATGPSYRVPASLLARSLRVQVSGAVSDWSPRTVSSPLTRVGRGRLRGVRLSIAGRPVVGRTLAVRGAAIRGAAIKVRWYAAGRRIPGAHRVRWTLRRGQVGKRVTVRVVASATAYDRLVRTSRPTGPVRRG